MAAADGPSGFEALLDSGELDFPALMALADRLAGIHGRATAADAAGITRSRRALESGATQAQTAELAQHGSKLDSRARLGRIRLLGDGEANDLLHDLALLLMEMWRTGLTTEANMLANRYVDVAPQGATGWSLLPLFLSRQAGAAGEAALADAVLAQAPPRLIAIGGLSGTGKTTLARLIGARIGRAPGARVLRSDVFRKRLAGVAPETRLPPRHYSARSDSETYEALFESADDHLACGNSVILDAVFMSRSERDVAEMIALQRRVPFAGIWLEAPERDRIGRVLARENDASDAGPEVVREQSRRPVGDVGWWNRIRVNRPIESIVAAARAAIDRAR